MVTSRHTKLNRVSRRENIMSTIFTAKVTIPAAPLKLERTFNFGTQTERDYFVIALPTDIGVLSMGTIECTNVPQALEQIEVERASVL